MSRPFIPVPNTCLVEMIYSSQLQVCENVFHVKGSAPFSAANIATLRGVFDTWDSGTQKTYRNANASLTRIRTKALDSLGAPFEDYSVSPARAGTSGGTQFPLSSTFALKLTTGLTGRSYRGRIYMVGLDANLVTGVNTVSLAAASAWVTMLTGLMTAITAANAAWHLAVVSYRTDKAWRSEGVATPVTAISYSDLNIDCQRRRLTGRGRA